MIVDWVEVDRGEGQGPIAAPAHVWVKAILAELPAAQKAAVIRRVESARAGRLFGGAFPGAEEKR